LYDLFEGRVFPGECAYYYFGDKLRAAQLLQSKGYPAPKGAFVRSPGDVDRFLAQTALDFPLVTKRASALSSNVRLARSVEEVFFPGLVQEFCPGSDGGYRIVVTGDRVMGFRRRSGAHDFGASGSEWPEYVDDLDRECVRLAYRISAENGFECMAYDMLRNREGNWVVVEFAYCFADSGPRDCPYYYAMPGGEKKDKTGVYPEDFILVDFLEKHSDSAAAGTTATTSPCPQRPRGAMQVHYINLPKRKARNARFLRMNAAIVDVQRVDAVEGSRLRTEDLIAEGIFQEPLKAYTPGSLGCTLSHRKMWELCVARATAVTVAEDDAVFNRRFPEKAVRLLASLPPDWDIVLWGWNFDAPFRVEIVEGVQRSTLRFGHARLGPRLLEFQQKDYDVMPLRLLTAFGTVCYSISPKGARQLLERCFPLKNEKVAIDGMRWRLPNTTVDVGLNKHYGALNAYVSFPPLVWTENDKTLSDVHPKGWSLARVGGLLYRTICRAVGAH